MLRISEGMRSLLIIFTYINIICFLSFSKAFIFRSSRIKNETLCFWGVGANKIETEKNNKWDGKRKWNTHYFPIISHNWLLECVCVCSDNMSSRAGNGTINLITRIERKLKTVPAHMFGMLFAESIANTHINIKWQNARGSL